MAGIGDKAWLRDCDLASLALVYAGGGKVKHVTLIPWPVSVVILRQLCLLARRSLEIANDWKQIALFTFTVA